MPKAQKVSFVWKCPHCGHRNKELFGYHFEIPKYYTAEWVYGRCEEESKIEIHFVVSKAYPEPKKTEMKKMDKGTKKDRGYRNNVKIRSMR